MLFPLEQSVEDSRQKSRQSGLLWRLSGNGLVVWQVRRRMRRRGRYDNSRTWHRHLGVLPFLEPRGTLIEPDRPAIEALCHHQQVVLLCEGQTTAVDEV